MASPFFMEEYFLARIIAAAARLGSTHALIQSSRIKPYMKKSEAFRQFGRKNVERWIAQGWITPRKDGDASAAWRIDRMEIEVLAAAIGLQQYL